MSYSTPRLRTFTADANFSGMQYRFVTNGTSAGHVDVCGSAGRAIGICMSSGVGSGEKCEVAMPGGGALLKIGASVTTNRYLISGASGVGVIAAAGSQQCGAIAMETGTTNDVIAVEVNVFMSTAADSNS